MAFAKNAERLGAPELVRQARQRAVEIRARAFGAKSDLERECLEAVYAYEEVLSVKHGKKTQAGRTWPMIKQLGILPAVERIVTRRKETVGYTALAEMGLERFAFEAVVLRYPKSFSAEAVERARERLQAHSAG